MKIKKYQQGLSISYDNLGSVVQPVPQIPPGGFQLSSSAQAAVNKQLAPSNWDKLKFQAKNLAGNISSTLFAQGVNQLTGQMFDDSQLGQNMATIFSSGLNSTGNTIFNNVAKGEMFSQGLSQNVGQSVGNAALGIGANYVGQGISSVMGNSMLGRFTGQTAATGLANAKTIASSVKAIKAAKTASKGSDLAKAGSLGKANLVGLGMSAVGAGLGAAFGASKEYGGRYGNITQNMDMAYDMIQGAAGFVPGVGTVVSGVMALNKGLSNVFGSTSGMTIQDSILGSAFIPAPVKWLNMAGASTTGTFNNQSWQNNQKATSFMGNAFGNLQKKFDQAREEAGKTYGTFSRGAKNRAQQNIDFANQAWGQIMDMADQSEYQNIRSQYMDSINTQRYAQMIQGGWSPISRGKLGMKILNNATNHTVGMRLLSGAALIDNKQIILSKCREN